MLKLLTKGTNSDKTSLQPKRDLRHRILESGTPDLQFTDAKPHTAQLCVMTSMKKKQTHADFRAMTQARPSNNASPHLEPLSDDEADDCLPIRQPQSIHPRITKFT